MIVHILKTVLQFSVLLLVFIIAFGLGFHLLLINHVSSRLKKSCSTTALYFFQACFRHPRLGAAEDLRDDDWGVRVRGNLH